MKSICNNCMNFPCTDDMSVMLKSCPAFSPIPKPKTNADRIRSMTDMELAEWLDHHVSCSRCPLTGECISLNTCSANLQKWLKEEVSDGV